MFSIKSCDIPRVTLKHRLTLVPNQKGVKTPLFLACISQSETRVETVRLLLENGANPNKPKYNTIKIGLDNGMDTYFEALLLEEGFLNLSKDEQKEIFELLLEYGADKNSYRLFHAMLDIIKHYSALRRQQIVDLFVETGFDLMEINYRGINILGAALQKGLYKHFEKYRNFGPLDNVGFASNICISMQCYEAISEDFTPEKHEQMLFKYVVTVTKKNFRENFLILLISKVDADSVGRVFNTAIKYHFFDENVESQMIPETMAMLSLFLRDKKSISEELEKNEKIKEFFKSSEKFLHENTQLIVSSQNFKTSEDYTIGVL